MRPAQYQHDRSAGSFAVLGRLCPWAPTPGNRALESQRHRQRRLTPTVLYGYIIIQTHSYHGALRHPRGPLNHIHSGGSQSRSQSKAPPGDTYHGDTRTTNSDAPYPPTISQAHPQGEILEISVKPPHSHRSANVHKHTHTHKVDRYTALQPQSKNFTLTNSATPSHKVKPHHTGTIVTANQARLPVFSLVQVTQTQRHNHNQTHTPHNLPFPAGWLPLRPEVPDTPSSNPSHLRFLRSVWSAPLHCT